MSDTQVRTADEVMRMVLDGEIRVARAAEKNGSQYTAMVGGEVVTMDADQAAQILVSLREKMQDGLRMAGLASRRAKRPSDAKKPAAAAPAPPTPESPVFGTPPAPQQ